MAASAEHIFPNETVRSLGDIGFDEDNWGVGVSGVVDRPSPFPRINRLRNWFLDEQPWTLDAERALLVTETYRKYENEPQVIKVAQSLAHILRRVSLEITADQLLLGNGAAPPKSCAIFPEFSFGWIAGELMDQPIRERPHNIYDYSDETEQALLSIEDYWKGRTLSDTMLARVVRRPGSKVIEGLGHGRYVLVGTDIDDWWRSIPRVRLGTRVVQKARIPCKIERK